MVNNMKSTFFFLIFICIYGCKSRFVIENLVEDSRFPISATDDLKDSLSFVLFDTVTGSVKSNLLVSYIDGEVTDSIRLPGDLVCSKRIGNKYYGILSDSSDSLRLLTVNINKNLMSLKLVPLNKIVSNLVPLDFYNDNKNGVLYFFNKANENYPITRMILGSDIVDSISVIDGVQGSILKMKEFEGNFYLLTRFEGAILVYQINIEKETACFLNKLSLGLNWKENSELNFYENKLYIVLKETPNFNYVYKYDLDLNQGFIFLTTTRLVNVFFIDGNEYVAYYDVFNCSLEKVVVKLKQIQKWTKVPFYFIEGTTF